MLSPGDRHISQLLGRAAAAAGRASAEDRRAVRAAWLAEHGAASLREMHSKLAELHRLNAGRHRAAARLFEQMAEHTSVVTGRRLIGCAADAVGSPSLALAMRTVDGEPAELLATDTVASEAQDLELVHGEGPLHDAMAAERALAVAPGGLVPRWPHYGARLADLGVQGVVAAPLRQAGAVLGAVGVFSRTAATPSRDELQDVADVLVEVIVAEAPELADEVDFGATDLGRTHQAVGMLSARLGCDTESALALMRARAFADGTPLTTVVGQVLDGGYDLAM